MKITSYLAIFNKLVRFNICYEIGRSKFLSYSTFVLVILFIFFIYLIGKLLRDF